MIDDVDDDDPFRLARRSSVDPELARHTAGLRARNALGNTSYVSRQDLFSSPTVTDETRITDPEDKSSANQQDSTSDHAGAASKRNTQE